MAKSQAHDPGLEPKKRRAVKSALSSNQKRLDPWLSPLSASSSASTNIISSSTSSTKDKYDLLDTDIENFSPKTLNDQENGVFAFSFDKAHTLTIATNSRGSNLEGQQPYAEDIIGENLAGADHEKKVNIEKLLSDPHVRKDERHRQRFAQLLSNHHDSGDEDDSDDEEQTTVDDLNERASYSNDSTEPANDQGHVAVTNAFHQIEAFGEEVGRIGHQSRMEYLLEHLFPRLPSILHAKFTDFIATVPKPSSVPPSLPMILVQSASVQRKDPWWHVDPAIKPRFLELVERFKLLAPHLPIENLTAPTGSLDAPMLNILHYPTFSCSKSNLDCGYTADRSNASLRKVDNRTGGLRFRGALVFDVVPYRTELLKDENGNRLERPYRKILPSKVLRAFDDFTSWILTQSSAKIVTIWGAVARSMYQAARPQSRPIIAFTSTAVMLTEQKLWPIFPRQSSASSSIERLVFAVHHPEACRWRSRAMSIHQDMMVNIACAILHRSIMHPQAFEMKSVETITGLVFALDPLVLASTYYQAEQIRGELFARSDIPQRLLEYIDTFDHAKAIGIWNGSFAHLRLAKYANAITPSFVRLDNEVSTSLPLDIVKILLSDWKTTFANQKSLDDMHVRVRRIAAMEGCGLMQFWTDAATENAINGRYGPTTSENVESRAKRTLTSKCATVVQREIQKRRDSGKPPLTGDEYDKIYIDMQGRPPWIGGLYIPVGRGDYPLAQWIARDSLDVLQAMVKYINNDGQAKRILRNRAKATGKEAANVDTNTATAVAKMKASRQADVENWKTGKAARFCRARVAKVLPRDKDLIPEEWHKFMK